MLLIDGVKYEEWTPPSEDDFEQVVKEHTQEIFGEQSIYLDRKQKLRSLAGVGAIPDALVIMFGNTPQWHIVEVELSSHDPYAHIVPQVDKFINAIDNYGTRNKIIGALYDAIDNDELLKVKTRQAIGQGKDIHKVFSDLIATPPTITIIIEKDTDQLEEALRKYAQKKVIEFQTFRRVEAEAVHAHLFEPLIKLTVVPPPPPPPPPPDGELEIVIRNPSSIKFHLFYIPKGKRSFFPGFKIPFTLETDIGEVQTHVASARAGTQVGDPSAGVFFQANLAEWYRRHSELKVGDRVTIKVIEPMKKYRLEIVK